MRHTQVNAAAVFGLMVLGCAAFQPKKTAGEVDVYYDQYEQHEIHRLTEMQLVSESGSETGHLQVLTARKPGSGKPENARFRVVTSSSDWKYLRCARLNVLADGKPVRFVTKPKHDGTVESDYVIEAVGSKISIAELEKMAKANRVRVRLCREEFSLTSDQIGTFRKFVSSVNRGTK